MINIRPVSDLRNKFADIEEAVLIHNAPVFLTKNGYGTMVLMSIQQYESMLNNIEDQLDLADEYAPKTSERLTANDLFSSIRSKIDHGNKI